MARRMTAAELDRLAQSLEPEIRRAFLEAATQGMDNVRISDLIELIESGRADMVADALGITQARYSALAEAFRSAYVTAAVKTVPEAITLVSNAPVLQSQWRAPASQAMRVTFNFDIRNPRAEAWLAEKSSNLITNIVADQRQAIRTTITEGMATGRGPRNTALDIVGRVGPTGRRAGGTIGLTDQQATFVANARRELQQLDASYFSRERRDKRFDAAVRKAIQSGKPLTQTEIDKITGRYSDRLLQLRGEMIARTESITAMNAAREESYRQAVEAGDIDPANVTGIWQATGDKRTRHTHKAMNGQRQAFEQPFRSPSGALLLYPGDTTYGAPASETIGCRCTKVYRIGIPNQVVA